MGDAASSEDVEVPVNTNTLCLDRVERLEELGLETVELLPPRGKRSGEVGLLDASRF